jgi:hypothetical protein
MKNRVNDRPITHVSESMTMIPRPSLTRLLIACVLVWGGMSAVQAAPTAEQIIAGAQMTAVRQQVDLQGRMTRGRDQVPVALFLRSSDIQFQYLQKQQWQTFHLRLKERECELFEMISGKQKAFPLSKLATPLAGLDLTYEDLALRFFYWKNPKLEGTERVGVHPCWKIRLNNPGQGGAYQVMYVWVHQKFGAFMKIEGFNRQGQILKRFEVIDVMKVDQRVAGAADVYTLKQMNVSTMNPQNGRTVSQTKLIFDAPKAAALQGPR